MPIDVLMPQLSPTMTEGRLANWTKKEGDKVSAGDIIAEVETDKATMEVEATDDGVIHSIIGEAGTDIRVGAAIAVLREEGEKVAKDYKPTSQVVTAESGADEAEDVKANSTVAAAPAAAPAAGMMAPPPMPKANLAPAQKIQKGVVQKSKDGHVKASPLARRIAADKGLDLSTIAGSGPKGRIMAGDVEKAPNFGGAREIARKKDSAVGLTPMRKAIANKLTSSKQHVPHFYLSMDAKVDALMDMRRQLNEYGEGQFKLSVNDFVLKACALALAEYPEANAAWAGDSVVNFGNVDISVAVSIEGGLITPIVFNADQKPIVQISREMKQLAKDARSNNLKPEQFEGGSFSLSNLGMFGVKQFQAIINPPQAAILACGGTEDRVVKASDGSFVTAKFTSLTLSVDHRVIDGALGAEVLGRIKYHLENPATLVL